MEIHELLTPDRIRIGLPGSSKKRVLENASELFAGCTVDPATIFQALFDRERLGSTGIGEGVALPHGRLKHLTEAIGALVVFEEPIDFEAVDQKPVSMAFILLVPEEATEEHLQLLAKLASFFSDAKHRDQVLAATTPEQIQALFQESNTHKLSA